MDTSEVIDDVLSREEQDVLFVEGYLSHFGVKGMSWGVRKAVTERWKSASKANVDRHYARRSARTARKKEKAAEDKTRAKGRAVLEKQKAAAKATKKAEKAVKREESKAKWDAYNKRVEDAKFEQTVKSPEFKARVHNETVNAMNNYYVPQINRKYSAYVMNGTLQNPNHSVTKQYHEEVMTAYVKEANKHISTITNASASKHLVAVRREPDEWAAFRGKDPADEFGFDIEVRDIEHADNVAYTVAGILDSKGLAVDFKIVPTTLTQGTMFVEDYLEHFGVKGMQWGVRRKATVGPQEVIVRDSRFPGSKRLVTKGGGGHPATSEATSSRRISQVAKSSGIKAVSNKELEEYNKRLNLEQNFSRLSYSDKNAGQKFIATLLGQGQRTLSTAGDQVASHQVRKRLEKRGLVAVSKKAAKKTGKIAAAGAIAAV